MGSTAQSKAGYLAIGTSTAPSYPLDVVGTIQVQGFKMTTGAGANKVLSSDASGLASWQTSASAPVSSVFGRTGAVVAVSGDYTTTLVTEGTNLYFTNARAQSAITGGASTITTSNLTTNRALLSDASGKVGVSAVTNTELGYVSGVTSAIQTQLNAKMSNPMTTVGAIIYGGTGGTPTSLAGSAGFLKSTGAVAPSFAALVAADIPSLDAGKITTGTFADARIASAATWNAKAPLASPAFTGTVSGITKAMVGLGSVDNTADSAKSVLYAATAGSAPKGTLVCTNRYGANIGDAICAAYGEVCTGWAYYAYPCNGPSYPGTGADARCCKII